MCYHQRSVTHVQIKAETRHFVGLYASPLGEQHMPYPLDICVNTEVSLSGGFYGIFSCNEAGDTVVYTHYEDDSSCSDDALASVGATYINDGLSAGDLFSFNCNGDNSYVETKSGINDPECDDSVVTTRIATNVCFRLPTGDSAMYV